MEFVWSDLAVLLNVICIDVVLAADNAVILGATAAKLPDALRRRAIVIGVLGAAVCRGFLAYFAVHLLNVVGISLAGGFLLFWVAWKLWRDLRNESAKPSNRKARNDLGASTLRSAIFSIIVADVSMSLDNTLAVAGAARDHEGIMFVGLAFSVFIMGAAAAFLATLIHRYRWISYLGLVMILYVALSMIWLGAGQVIRSF